MTGEPTMLLCPMCHRELAGADGVRVEVIDGGAADSVRVCSVLCALRWFSYYQVHRPLPSADPPPTAR